jgi:hypothetical protein
MEALDMMKFGRHTCPYLGEKGIQLPNSSKATKPVETLVALLLWSKLILVPSTLELIPVTYIPSPLISQHKIPSPSLTGV